jgi:ribose transport system permease protein
VNARRTRTLGLDRFSGLYLWAIFIVVFGVWEPSLFLTSSTLHTIASSQAVAAMLSLGLVVALVCGVYDLSIGATANLTALVVTLLQTSKGMDMWVAIALSLLVGAAIGGINAFIVVKLRVNSFIATLGMTTIIGAVQTIVTNGSQPAPPISSSWANLTQVQVGGFQIILVYLVVIAVVLWWMLEHTPAGRYMYAVGSNRDAARLSGVRVDRWSALSLVMSASISGLAGVLFASSAGPSLTFGPALLLPAFAAAFLGSTQLKPGRFNVWGTLLAVYVLATGETGLGFVTGAQWLSDMFNGVALIVAVSLATWRQSWRITRRQSLLSAGAVPDAAEADAAELRTTDPPSGTQAGPATSAEARIVPELTPVSPSRPSPTTTNPEHLKTGRN